MAAPTVLVLTEEFLPASEVFVFRRVTQLRQIRAAVACLRRENPRFFPFEPVHELRMFSTNLLLRGANFVLRRLGLIGMNESVEGIRHFRSLLAGVRPDLILCESGWVAVQFASRIEATALPVAVTFWGSDINEAESRPAHLARLSRVFRRADLLIYCSDFLKRRGLELGCPPERSVVIYNGVEVPEEITWQPAPDGTFRLLCIARMSPAKGLDVLMQAVRLALDAGVRLRLTHVGAGERDAEIRALAGELGLAGQVRFLGALANREALAHCADSDVMVLSSVRCTNGQEEASGVVLMEAGAHGLPVIASDIGGVAETAVNEKTGLLVPEKDPQALAEAILRLVRNPAEARALGAAGRERVKERFEVSRQVSEHERALLGLIGDQEGA